MSSSVRYLLSVLLLLAAPWGMMCNLRRGIILGHSRGGEGHRGMQLQGQAEACTKGAWTQIK